MKPWRQIARPHQDVLDGTFTSAEFAVDLNSIDKGNGPSVYQDPKSFFERTFITEGMRQLLISVAKRLANQGGDPVIQLKTGFGGGKTHTLLAVYHLVQQMIPTSQMSGISQVLDKAGIINLPKANIVIFDGNAWGPNEPLNIDGLTIKTLWGLIAYKLLGKDGYEMVAQSDKSGTSPGKNILISLLQKAAPCVILLDELVVFIRQLHEPELTAGTYDVNMAFMQALTESVKQVPNAILLASLPESDTEAGGEYGKQALAALSKLFGRVESVWKTVGTEESFEIVRRRLFDDVGSVDDMEDVCTEYSNFYQKHKKDFPPEAHNSQYIERLRKSYPIHPEIFDRLFEDWSTLDGYQKTRGVLQYLATIINQLWTMNDQDSFIMPGSIPLSETKVQAKSIEHLNPGWDPIIEREIDGPASIAFSIDKNDTRFGGIQAAHRLARTIFLGSAPSSATQNSRGIALERILLGCAVPGQTLSIYQDALNRMRDRMHYLNADDNRYWFDTHPNLRKEMEGRKAKLEQSKCDKEIQEATSKICHNNNAPFAGIHVFQSHQDIPDNANEAPRLVLLPPKSDVAYEKAAEKNARNAALFILNHRGTNPRMYKNRLIFLAPDISNLDCLKNQCRTYLAWKEISEDSEVCKINLDMIQKRNVERELDSARKAFMQSIRETYRFLMIPMQEDPKHIGFDIFKISSSTGNLLDTVTRELDNETIIKTWSSMNLWSTLKQFYFNAPGKTEVNLKTLWEDSCKYNYLPRLFNRDVLVKAIRDGVQQGYFGYAAGKAEDKNTYLSFVYNEQPTVMIDGCSLLIESETAKAYKKAIEPNEPTPPPVPPIGSTVQPPTPPQRPEFRHYYGQVKLNQFDSVTSFQCIYDELIAQFVHCSCANMKLTLNIEVDSENAFDDGLIRGVNENAKTLGFDSTKFEK